MVAIMEGSLVVETETAKAGLFVRVDVTRRARNSQHSPTA